MEALNYICAQIRIAKFGPMYLAPGHPLSDSGRTTDAVADYQKSLRVVTSVDNMVAIRVGLKGDSVLHHLDQIKA